MSGNDDADLVCGLFAILTGELEDAITPAFEGQQRQSKDEALARAQTVLATTDRIIAVARAIVVLLTRPA
ncbi:hypothetical protein F1C10_14620 [Sphingomonas sp. NBWT7]|uniref:hypothetical protein n=1 Tax=Sphingomonas sp. NBWT7 TaxID=2596913 RepID=UPI0016273421|nr:hypothetical protein [Sphingomonas sp. NBWT7]QNE33029.1 hypothetical protein F1C10_14620 [Sphingomonas sp. NBWT7]